jgi:hypothetical protein
MSQVPLLLEKFKRKMELLQVKQAAEEIKVEKNIQKLEISRM